MTQERRKVPRYRLETDIAINRGGARTVNISSNSVYLETASRYEPGEEISLVLPLRQVAPDASVECAGLVVRVDQRGALFGVAAIYEPTEFNVRE